MNRQLVERPNRPGYAQAAWDILSTMDNKWLSTDEIFNLLDETLRRKKKARLKLQAAITNGIERGMFVYVGESRGNVSNKKYRLASKDHRDAMMAKYRAKVEKWNATQKSESPRSKKPKGQGVNGQQERSDLVRTIDSKIAVVEQRLAALNEMRRLAMNLGDF